MDEKHAPLDIDISPPPPRKNARYSITFTCTLSMFCVSHRYIKYE